jgi:transcriptional regulator with XRE-family HTH domain
MVALKAVREKRGLSQRELAAAVGISQPAIAQIENGQTQPTLNNLVKIAEVLQVSLCELVDT